MSQQYSEAARMQLDQRLRQSLAVRSKQRKRRLGETALDYPTVRQQNQVSFGRRQIDDFQLVVICPRVQHRLTPRVAPNHENLFDGRSRQHLLTANHAPVHARFRPARCLHVHHIPRRSVVGHHAPRYPGAYNLACASEHLVQGVLAPRGVFRHQGSVSRYKRPLRRRANRVGRPFLPSWPRYTALWGRKCVQALVDPRSR